MEIPVYVLRAQLRLRDKHEVRLTRHDRSLQSGILVSIKDFVTGFTRDVELAAQRRYLLALHEPSYKPQPFVHFGTLLPRHLRVPRKCAKVLPMWSEFV